MHEYHSVRAFKILIIQVLASLLANLQHHADVKCKKSEAEGKIVRHVMLIAIIVAEYRFSNSN